MNNRLIHITIWIICFISLLFYPCRLGLAILVSAKPSLDQISEKQKEKSYRYDEKGPYKVWIKNNQRIYIQAEKRKSRLVLRAKRHEGFTYPELSPNGKWLIITSTHPYDLP